jgi:hypothetical protein
MTPSRPFGPPWAPLLLIAVLVLGSLAHLGHHLADPGCDSGASPHPCVACSSLHGAALAAEGVTAQPPARVAARPQPSPVPASPAAPVLAAGGPRAPPAA